MEGRHQLLLSCSVEAPPSEDSSLSAPMHDVKWLCEEETRALSRGRQRKMRLRRIADLKH